MPLVSITRLRVRSWRYFVPFVVRAMRSAFQAKRSEGNLAVTILRQPRNTFWTRTMWSSEAAMRSYMLAEPHGSGMRRLLEWCDEASVVHWTQESPRPPAWAEAHKRMQDSGRPSKVNHPTPDHTAYRIPPLSLPVRGELQLK